jgi:cytidine deaminase
MNSLTYMKSKCSKCKKEWSATMYDFNVKTGDIYKTCGSCRDKQQEYYGENRPEILHNDMIRRIKKKKLEDEKQ